MGAEGTHGLGTDERANPSRGGDAILRDSLSRPGYRIGSQSCRVEFRAFYSRVGD
jgi:hypothetical protein